MRSNKNLLITLIMMIIVAALYRVIPNRPMGFAPQLAMALFGGAVIKDRKWAFALPVFSMFISDVLYQGLYAAGLTTIPGIYEGQFTNYILFAAMTIMGFMMKKVNIVNVIVYSFAVSVAYFIVSNFFVWISGAGYSRPKNMAGLIACYTDALPFFYNSLIATLFFSGILFGTWKLLSARTKPVHAM